MPSLPAIHSTVRALALSSRLAALSVIALLPMLVACAGPRQDSPSARTGEVAAAEFSAVDIETTGFSPKKDRIIEIGVVKLRGTAEVGRTNWLVNPGIPVPASAVSVHGITSEMLKDSPAFAKAVPAFADFIGDSVLLIHNARFDTAFFGAELARAGIPAPTNIVIDTLPVCRKWFANTRRHGLESITEYLGIAVVRRHRAVDDAGALAAVFAAGLKTQPAAISLADLVAAAGGVYRLDGRKSPQK